MSRVGGGDGEDVGLAQRAVMEGKALRLVVTDCFSAPSTMLAAHDSSL